MTRQTVRRQQSAFAVESLVLRLLYQIPGSDDLALGRQS